MRSGSGENSRRFGAPGRLLVAALLTTLALVALSGTRAAAAGLPTGITNTGESSRASFDTVRSTGSSYVRIPLDWASTVPAQEPGSWNPSNPRDPAYNWGQWDEQVANAVNAGLVPILQLGGPPRWAQRCQTPAAFPWAVCDPDPAMLAAFATAAARHFNGGDGPPRVRYWQVLNEPNLTLFFFPQYSSSGKALSPTLYRQLINAAYAGIKSVDPSNLVLLAGLGPIAVKNYTIGPMQFARELLCMKGRRKPKKAAGNCEGGVHFDIFAIQPYTTGGPTHRGGPDDVQIGDIPKLQKLIAAADRAKRIKGSFKRTPLWITEFSWDTKPPDPNGLPMKIESRWISEALYLSWRNRVANFLWYSLKDPVYTGGSHSTIYESGLFFANGRPKPILNSFRFPFVAYPGPQLSFWGRTPTSKPGPVKIQLRGNGGWKTVATSRADGNGIFRGKIASSFGRNKKGAARALFAGQKSTPFSMRPVPDFHHPPFG